MSESPILSSSNNLNFAPDTEVMFSDNTSAEFEEIGLRSLRLRPQRSQAGELWCVVTATFLIDGVIAGDEENIHTLCDEDDPFGAAYQQQTIKRLETERWIPWNRVPSLQALMLQLQDAGYDIEATEPSYEEVKQWFEDNPKKTTMEPESTWMEFSAPRNIEPLPATFVASVSDMQEATTQSVFKGLNQIQSLIKTFTKEVNDNKATRETKSQFRALVGNVMGYHTTNDDKTWGNKLALIALTVDGKEYSLFFDRNKEKVTDVRDKFANVMQDKQVTKTASGVDIAAILSGAED